MIKRKVILSGKKAYKLKTKWRGDIVETNEVINGDIKIIAIVYGDTLEQMRLRQRTVAESLRADYNGN